MFSNRFMGKKLLRANLPSRVAHKWLLVASVSLLGFAVGCGGSSGPSVPVTGNFSNSSLSGSYAYHLNGINTNGQYAEAGVFTADGNGNITSGVDDLNQLGNQAGFSPGFPITGRYTIGKDGNGTILFTLTSLQPPNTFQVSITMVSTSQLYMTEADTFANASGEANQQDTSAFSAPPTGTFAFRLHDVGSTSSASLLGATTFSGTGLSGTLDELRGGALDQNVAISASSVQAPDSTGRGTFSFTDSLNITGTYVYYVINSSTVELLQQDANHLAIGRMEKQSGGPYKLSGNYVFGSQGDTSTILGVRSAGGFTSDGTSQITGGAYDSVQDGNQIVNQPFTGSFTQTSNGRIAVTLNPNGGSPISEVFWMVNSGRAFFLVNDSSKVEDGTMDQQQSMTFANGSLTGQYAFGNDGFFFQSSFPFLTRVGTFIPDGNGNVKLNETTNSFDLSQGGAVGSVVVGGTYTVGAPGRATVTLAGSQGNINLVLYMLSPSAAYVIENDSGTEIGGKMAIQVSP